MKDKKYIVLGQGSYPDDYLDIIKVKYPEHTIITTDEAIELGVLDGDDGKLVNKVNNGAYSVPVLFNEFIEPLDKDILKIVKKSEVNYYDRHYKKTKYPNPYSKRSR